MVSTSYCSSSLMISEGGFGKSTPCSGVDLNGVRRKVWNTG